MNKKMCLIGKNLSHSLSPKLYNDYFKNNNIDIEYSLCDIDNINDFMINKKDIYISFNVTHPYKTQIIKYLDNRKNFINESPNLIINKNNKLIGFNTDGIGFYDSLIENEINPNNKNITIIGFGGAGKSIYEYLSKNTNAKINVLTHKDTNILFNEINETNIINNSNQHFDILLSILCKTDILINASAAGFNNNEETPIPLSIAKKIYEKNNNLIYIDIIYKNKTKLLSFFENLNVKTLNGLPMLKAQFNNNIKILKNNNLFYKQTL